MRSGALISLILVLVVVMIFISPIKVLSLDNQVEVNGEVCTVIQGTEHKCCKDTWIPGVKQCHTCYEDIHSGDFTCKDDWTYEFGRVGIIKEPSSKGQSDSNIGNNAGVLIDRETAENSNEAPNSTTDTSENRAGGYNNNKGGNSADQTISQGQ